MGGPRERKCAGQRGRNHISALSPVALLFPGRIEKDRGSREGGGEDGREEVEEEKKEKEEEEPGPQEDENAESSMSVHHRSP